MSEFSGAQLLDWYHEARRQCGFDKLIDLQVRMVPEMKDRQEALCEVTEKLIALTRRDRSR